MPLAVPVVVLAVPKQTASLHSCGDSFIGAGNSRFFMARSQNGQKTKPETIEARMKAAKALELRMEGKSFDQIAEEAGYNSRQAAHDAVKRALDRIEREPADALVKLDLERLDVLWQIQYLNAQSGDVQAMAACMKIMERRARLLGLDAPIKTDNKTEVSGKDGVLVIGQTMTPEEWELAAKEQQAALTKDAG